MPIRRKRFSITRKIALGLALIIAIGMASMFFIYRGLNEVESATQRLAAVQAPISAAAYEMELNVNGGGLAVLKYLATRRPEYRAWAENDERDFAHYHTTYLKLVRTEHERNLGTRLGELHEKFDRLGHTLMNHADRQEKLYASIEEDAEEIDYILDARLQPGLFDLKSGRSERFGPAVVSTDLEAEAAEVGLSVANYHRQPTPAARRTIMSKLSGLEKTFASFNSFNLTAAERQHARTLRAPISNIAASVKEVIALEDEILAGRGRFIELRAAMDQLLDEEIQVMALRDLDRPREDAETAADAVLHAMRYLIPIYLLAAGVVGILLVHVIRKPLRELNKGTRAIAEGDLTYHVNPIANDEFGDLANQFNRMVEQLEATTVSRDRLEESEGELRRLVFELRREIAERERAEREREQLQAELRRNETMSAMGALVAGVAHEVRNPLFGISSTLDAMNARLGDNTQYRRYLDVLRNEVSRLSKLMGDLLSYGKPPTWEFTIGPVQAVIARGVEACRELARQARVRIAEQGDGAVGMIRLDSSRLIQAFQNLIDNALQHSPPDAVVTIDSKRVSENGHDWIECSVTDSGPGFRPEDLKKVFDPFFTRRRGGTGLGLALVQRIVNEHGGEVFASNRPEGGAVVTMRFPEESS